MGALQSLRSKVRRRETTTDVIQPRLNIDIYGSAKNMKK
jgi:hypothetical protein